jgi:biopolymer transport protein ExbB
MHAMDSPTRRRLAVMLLALLTLSLALLASQSLQAQDTAPPPPETPEAVPAATPGSADASSGASGASGGDASGGGIDPLTGELPTLGWLFMTSPIINGIIALLSLIAVAVFLYLLTTINSRAMVPPDLVDEVTKLVINRQYAEAADVTRRSRRTFVSSIIQRSVEHAQQEHSIILDMIDAEGRRRADILWNRVSYLSDISNIAPMLGLLGTVLGMIKAFFGLERQTGSIDAQILANGVGEAMATTAFGLVVGILALVFYTIIKGRATRTLAEAEQAVHSIADHIKRGA